MSFDFNQAVHVFIDEIQKRLEVFVRALPNLALALIVLLITFFVSKVLVRLLNTMFARTTQNQAVVNLIKKMAHLALWALGVFIALGVLNLDKTVTSLLAGAGVIGLALGFAFQEIATNFVSGVLIAVQEPYRLGDIVEIGPYLGWVHQVELRSTTIHTFDGQDVIVPNKQMYTQPLSNWSLTPMRRLEIKIGVSYEDDLEKVERVAIAAVENIPGRVKENPVGFFYEQFSESSLLFNLQVWVDYPADNNFNRFRHAAIKAIKVAFDRNQISIPFPVRTLELSRKGIENWSDLYEKKV